MLKHAKDILTKDMTNILTIEGSNENSRVFYINDGFHGLKESHMIVCVTQSGGA